MRMQSFLPALLVGAALTGLAVVPGHITGETKDKIDAAAIDKLVEQLGSDTFAEREAASAALAKMGKPALGSLRKAMTSKDNEIRKRAKDILTKLEKEVASAEVLTPTKVHLVYKDTPLKEALEDFKKQTGARIVLHDPDKKLEKTKVTLDTGKTTFWDALEKFCDAAGVVEGDPNGVGAPGGAAGIGIAQPFGVRILQAPALAPPPPPIRVPVKPVEKKKAVVPDEPASCDDDAEKRAAEEKAAADARKAADAKAKEEAKAKVIAQPALVQIQIQIGGGVAMPVAPIGPWMGMPGRPGMPGQITLIPGKSVKVPTDASSSIRVRIGDKNKVPAAPNAKEFDLVLQVSPEPRLNWQSLIGITIDKAIDDNGDKLKQVVAKADPNGAPGGGRIIFIGGAPGGGAVMPGWGGPGGMWNQGNSNGMHHYVPVKLEKGAKASKSLKELTGTITAHVQTPPEVMMTIDDLAKAKGKGVKGKAGSGDLEIVSYAKDDEGTVTIAFTFTQPDDITPEAPVAMPPMMALPGGARQRVILPPGGIAMPGGVAMPFYGLTLRDDKDNVLPASIQVNFAKDGGLGAPRAKLQLVATYTPAKGAVAEPAKLVFSGRKTVAVDIPFTLKDITLE